MVDLELSYANGVSGDGKVVVGDSQSYVGYQAFIWDETNGMRPLQSVLINDYGLDLNGWQLTLANAISRDGRTIVGTGVNPNGKTEGYIVTLPEPGTLTLLTVGVFTILRR